MYCFGYTFPFPIICAADVRKWPIAKIDLGSTECIAYPPFRCEEPNRKSCPVFEFSASPALRRKGIKTEMRSLGFSALPTFLDDGHQEKDKAFEHLNALQIDIKTKNEETAAKKAKTLSSNMIRHLRRNSQQFWLGNFPSYFENYLQVQFEVDANYNLREEPWSTASVYSGTERMMPITWNIWQSSWAQSKHAHIPDELDFLLAADHHVASEDLFLACMQAALSLEKIKYAMWRDIYKRGICSKSELKSAENDTKLPHRYFCEILEEKIRLNLSKANPEACEHIKKVWLVRGLVAHGKENSAPAHIERELTQRNVSSWVNSIFDVAKFSKTAAKATRPSSTLR